MKKSKEIYRIDIYAHGYGQAHSRKIDASDPDYQDFVRAKRNIKHVPDWDNTGTRWIKRQKNWKSRCKKRKQWEKHDVSDFEKEIIDPISLEKERLLCMYPDNVWRVVDEPFNKTLKNMINNGIFEGKYKTVKIERNENGKIVSKEFNKLIGVRRKIE